MPVNFLERKHDSKGNEAEEPEAAGEAWSLSFLDGSASSLRQSWLTLL